MKSRILPEPLTVFPLMATSATNDAEWAAVVAWTVHVLVSAERPETHWYHGGAKALPIVAPDLGLDQGWQDRVIAAVGHYGQIYRPQSRQGLAAQFARGLNANQLGGGLMLSPFLE